MIPVVFVAPNCAACVALKRAFDRAGMKYRTLGFDSVRAIEYGVRSVPAVFVGDVRVGNPTVARVRSALERAG